MPTPNELSIALKEWDSVCTALLTGRQIMLLRKGGIQEAAGGFQLEHAHFLLMPTFLHQNTAMLKPDAAGLCTSSGGEPETLTLGGACEVTHIIRLRERAQMDALDDEHIWAKPLIEMRYNYRPANPLYLILVQVSRLLSPVRITNTPEYAGCKSWVPLERAVAIEGAAPVMPDAEYATRVERVLAALDRSSSRLD